MQVQCSIQIHCLKNHSVWYELCFKKYLIAYDSSGSNGWARVKRERSRENAHYEWYCFIQVTCKMNANGQTWNENIWTVTRPKEKTLSWQLSEVKPMVVAQIYKASLLAFSDINRNQRLRISPRSPCSAVTTGLLKTSRTQHKNRQKWHSVNTCLKHIQNHNLSSSWTQK